MDKQFGNIQPKGFPSLPQDWIYDSEMMISQDGTLQLYLAQMRSKTLQQNPKTLVIFHGQGEHSGRYLHVPHYVQKTVSRIYALDHRGHGRSEGLRGHVDSFDLYALDAAQAIKKIHEALVATEGKSEIHVMAHSMGGLIVLRMMMLDPDLPIRSVTISSPLLGIRVPVPAIKKYPAYVLSVIWGSIQMTNGIDAKLISHDPAVQEAYVKDRLNHNKVTPRFFTELQKAMAAVNSYHDGFNAPLQMLISSADQIVDPEKSQVFMEHLTSGKHKAVILEGFYHEPWNEGGVENVDKQTAFNELNAWILDNP